MRKILIAALLAAALLLPGCANSREDAPAASTGGSGLPIDITYVSYGDDIDWQHKTFEHGGYTFQMPEGWQTEDGAEYGLVNGVFIMPQDTDMDDFRFSPHVAVELTGSAPGGDYANEAVQKDFFASQIVSTYSKMGSLSDLEFMVWEAETCYVYIAQFKRSNDVLSMYQTTYYVMNPGGMMTINASHFGEDSSPDVNTVAQHLINTFE